MDDIITYTEARKNLSALMDRVVQNHEAIAITRGNREPVIMVSLSDFRGYEETAYLMSTEANRKAMNEAINDIRQRKNLVTKTMEELEKLASDDR